MRVRRLAVALAACCLQVRPAESTPPASGHPRNETLPRILGALVDPRTAEDRLVCQVCDTKYGRRDSEK